MPTAKASSDPLDLQIVRDLASVLDETGLTEIEIDRNGTRIRVARHPAAVATSLVSTPAQPGAEPFARLGDMVAEGQTLLLVEAMKTMNPITAPRAGRIVEFLVSDSQPVEYGEPLVVIE
jgi:acetyl-CoA carboxylase biotin carboxyl carrier protein